MNADAVFASYPAFKALPAAMEDLDRETAVKEIDDLLERWSDRIEVRGIYSTVGFRADTDLLLWLISRSPDDLQAVLADFRKTRLGRCLEQSWSFLGVVRPAEFSPDHRPAFVEGKPPRKYACVYPFVRTPDWYLLAPEDRATHLRAHGELGREYPDVTPNTTSAFGLGDYEWILAFEADSLERLVDLIRHLRANESRRYVSLEVPFVTGIRKDVTGVVADLP